MNYENIKYERIEKYDNPYDMFSEYGFHMDEKQAEYIRHLCDYEPICFYVHSDPVAGHMVYECDSIIGAVFNKQPLLMFYCETILEYYKNESETGDR